MLPVTERRPKRPTDTHEGVYLRVAKRIEQQRADLLDVTRRRRFDRPMAGVGERDVRCSTDARTPQSLNVAALLEP